MKLTKYAVLTIGLSCSVSAFADRPTLMGPYSDTYHNSLYLGIQGSLAYMQTKSTFNNGPRANLRDSKIGMLATAYAGYGTDFSNGFYLGGELGASYQPRPDRSSGAGGGAVLLYAPYGFYADIIPGIATEDGLLFYARVGVQGNEYQFDRYAANGGSIENYSPDSKFALGIRAGLGLEDKLTNHVTLRAQATFVQMFSFDISQGTQAVPQTTTSHPQYILASLGLTYRFPMSGNS